MTFSGPYEGIQRPYGRIWAGGEKKSKPWLPTGVMTKTSQPIVTNDIPLESLDLGRESGMGAVSLNILIGLRTMAKFFESVPLGSLL